MLLGCLLILNIIQMLNFINFNIIFFITITLDFFTLILVQTIISAVYLKLS